MSTQTKMRKLWIKWDTIIMPRIQANLRRKGRSDARIPIERDIDAEFNNQRLDGRREKVAGPRIDRL
jgi:hypothetical protein